MSLTLAQISVLNPTTVVADTDLFYLVQSPYTPGTDAAITGADLKIAFGSGGTINAGLINQLAFYAANGTTLSGLPTANNGVLITSGAGVPSISSTLPTVVQDNITRLGAQAEPLNMAGFQINNVLGGTNPQDAVILSQLQTVSQLLTTKGDLFTFTTVNARLPVAVGDGKILQVSSATATGLAYSTPAYPSLSGTLGTILRSNGTNNVYSTSTFADTYAASNLLFANGANNVEGLPTLANGTLITSGAGVPSISQTLPTAVQDNITRLGTIASIGAPLGGTFGGTGINNSTRTITIGGNIVTANSFTTVGNFAVTQTYTGVTNVTFPTSGTLSTTTGTVTSVGTAGLATGGPITSTGTVTVTAAVQADMETATSTTTAVTPAVVQFHPAVSKAWAMITNPGGTPPTISASYNVSSIVRNSTGNYTLTLTNGFSSSNYSVIVSPGGTQIGVSRVNITNGTTFVIIMANPPTGTATDMAFSFVCYGDQ